MWFVAASLGLINQAMVSIASLAILLDLQDSTHFILANECAYVDQE